MEEQSGEEVERLVRIIFIVILPVCIRLLITVVKSRIILHRHGNCIPYEVNVVELLSVCATEEKEIQSESKL